jgi:hypothetical protein
MVSLQVIRAKISHTLISIDSGIFFFPLGKFRQKEKFKITNFAKKKRKGSDFARFLVTRTEERGKNKK